MLHIIAKKAVAKRHRDFSDTSHSGLNLHHVLSLRL